MEDSPVSDSLCIQSHKGPYTLTMLPELLQTLAPAWPAYHLAQVAQQAVGVGAGRSLGLHLAVLAAITAVFFVLARRRLVQ